MLSADEVARLIDAAPNLRYRTILMTLYSTGMRRAELCHLRPEDIDKERMVRPHPPRQRRQSTAKCRSARNCSSNSGPTTAP